MPNFSGAISVCCPTQVCREALAIAPDGMAAMFVIAADNDLSAVSDPYDRMAAPPGSVVKREPGTLVPNDEEVSADAFMDSAAPTKIAEPTRGAARTESPRRVSGTEVARSDALMEFATPDQAAVPIHCDARMESSKHVNGTAVAAGSEEPITRGTVAPRNEPDATAESHPRNSVALVNAVGSTDHVEASAPTGRVVKPSGSLNDVRSIVYQCNAQHYNIKPHQSPKIGVSWPLSRIGAVGYPNNAISYYCQIAYNIRVCKQALVFTNEII